jgi:uncharacterized membrane protein YjgN (DUF898 family)
MQVATPAASGSASLTTPHHVSVDWHGNPWSLTGLAVLNFILTVATLGVYSFWGRTEVRKRIWSATRLDGEPLAYMGTGKELFLGFLVVFALVLVPAVLAGFAVAVAFGPQSPAAGVLQLALYAMFFYLAGVATHRARRYRLSRTRWRGIRGALEGSAWGYGWTYVWTAVLMFGAFIALFAGLALLGNTSRPDLPPLLAPWTTALIFLVGIVVAALIAPWRSNKLTGRITRDMRFGDTPFDFVGTARPLYARFVARWAGVLLLAVATMAAIYFWIGSSRLAELAVPGQGRRSIQLTGREVAGLFAIGFVAVLLLSVVTAWYKAFEANYFASMTRFQNVPLKLAVTARGLIWLYVTNYLVSLLSLGILRPVAQARTARYFVNRFEFDGPIDTARVLQSSAALSKTGEGLAQAFDVDAF